MKKILTFIMLLCIMITLMIPKITTHAYSTDSNLAYLTMPYVVQIHNVNECLSTLEMSTHDITPTSSALDMVRHNAGASALMFRYYSEEAHTSLPFHVNYIFEYEYGWDTDIDLILDDIDSFCLTFNDLTINRNDISYFPVLWQRSNVSYDITTYYVDQENTLKRLEFEGTIYDTTTLFDNSLLNEIFLNNNLGNIYLYEANFFLEPIDGWLSQTYGDSFGLSTRVYDTVYNGKPYNRPFSPRLFIDAFQYEMPTFDGGTWLATAVGGFLNTPLFGFISIGMLLMTVIAIPLVIALLKFFAGG